MLSSGECLAGMVGMLIAVAVAVSPLAFYASMHNTGFTVGMIIPIDSAYPD